MLSFRSFTVSSLKFKSLINFGELNHLGSYAEIKQVLKGPKQLEGWLGMGTRNSEGQSPS